MCLIALLRGLAVDAVSHDNLVFYVIVMLVGSLVWGGYLTLVLFSLPYRIFLNVTRPERRKARWGETIMCIVGLLALILMLVTWIMNPPFGGR
jgi:hypothetical protein